MFVRNSESRSFRGGSRNVDFCFGDFGELMISVALFLNVLCSKSAAFFSPSRLAKLRAVTYPAIS